MSDLPAVKSVETLDHKITESVFLPAFVEDNPLLLQRDPDYISRLELQDDRTYKALRYGDWSVFAGQFLPEFSYHTHVIKPFEIPRNWRRKRGYDWGFAAEAAMYWIATDPATKRLYVYREFYEAGLTDPQQAEAINDMTQVWEKFSFNYADPSIWTSRTTERVAKSTADVFQSYSILMTKADNDQIAKSKRLRSALAPIHDGKPGILIFNTCTNLIAELEGLMTDPDHPEKPLPNQQDHAYDALCYGLTGYSPPRLVDRDKKKEKPKNIYSGVKGL
jgi:phage terminase large subunit